MIIAWLKYRAAVVRAAQRLAEQGLVHGTSGNVSARLTDRALMAITPSSTPYDVLCPEHIVVTDLVDIEPVHGDGIPSTEALLHAAIYRRRPDVGAIAHTHSTFATAVAVAGMDIPPLMDEMTLTTGGSVRVSEYAFPGSERLADNVCAALGDRNAALIRNHGAVGVGVNLQHAMDVCALVERAAQVFLYASLLGGANPLPPDVVDSEISLYKMRRQSFLS